MRLFKTADKKFEDIGFVKVEENEYCAIYDKMEKQGYIHRITLLHKHNDRHIVQSYVKDKDDMVGLSMYETKLCLKKMKEKGWKVKK